MSTPSPLSALVVHEKIKDSDLLKQLLEKKGFMVDQASNGYSGLNYLGFQAYDVAFFSTSLPLFKTGELMSKCRKIRPDTKVILVGDITSLPASFVNSPEVSGVVNTLHDWSHLDQILDKTGIHDVAPNSGKENVSRNQEDKSLTDIVGDSQVMQNFSKLLHKIAASSITVMIYGESGTGKELTARALHERGPRKDKPLVIVNCAAIPENLLESELFGHTKGSFTGAVSDRIGRFEQANTGTLFLDEIGELSLPLQAKLLRVLEEQTFERVGSNETIQVDVRIVSATNRDLKIMAEQKVFREDLYYRLSALSLCVPPLRERKEDIGQLINYFLKKYIKKTGKQHGLEVSPQALSAMHRFQWPGNVRELENVVMRAMVLCDGHIIQLDDLPPEIKNAKGDRPASEKTPTETQQKTIASDILKCVAPLSDIECEAIKKALEQNDFNATKAARVLKIGRMTFYRKAKFYGIPMKRL